MARQPFVQDFLDTAQRECFAKLEGVVPVPA
jgi:hypothetical protein